MNSLDHCKSLLTGPLTSSFTPYSLFMTGQPQEILLKCKILSPLCSKPLWFPISLGAKVKDLTITLKTLHHLPCTFTSDMSPVTPSCWLPHSARAAIVSCFFPKPTRNSATPGPLPLLVPLLPCDSLLLQTQVFVQTSPSQESLSWPSYLKLPSFPSHAATSSPSSCFIFLHSTCQHPVTYYVFYLVVLYFSHSRKKTALRQGFLPVLLTAVPLFPRDTWHPGGSQQLFVESVKENRARQVPECPVRWFW